MCTVIDADCILANLLQTRDVVTVRDLNEVRSSIERRIPGVYVDVTKNCVAWAVNQRPEMYKWIDQTIRRSREWSAGFVEEYFNWRIPSEVRAGVLEIIRSNSPEA